MYLSIIKSNNILRERLAEDYYYQSEMENGASLFRPVSLHMLKNEIHSNTLRKLDKNYSAALRSMKLAFDVDSDLVTLYADNGYLIAHSTIGKRLDLRTAKNIPFMTDFIIRNGDDLTVDHAGGIDFKSGIYKKMLEFAEESIFEAYPNAGKYLVYTNGLDGDFWKTLESAGYSIQESDDIEGELLLLSKPYDLERKNLSARNTTVRQRTKQD